MRMGPGPTIIHQTSQTEEGMGQGGATHNGAPAFVIAPARAWTALNLVEIWRYRELLYFFTWRDLKVRYKQTTIGVAWALLQPFMTTVAFSLTFGYLTGLSSDSAAYPVFSYAALLPWTFFAAAINRAGMSLVSDANMISKVYFPRLIVPIAAVLAITVDLLIAFVLLLVMLLFYGIMPGAGVLSLPFFVLMALMTAFGVGFWLASLNVKYRDVVYVLPFLTQFWLFVTPVAYSSSIIPERWRLLYGLNPMAGVVEGFRWALLGQGRPPDTYIAVSIFVTVALFVSGLFYFRRTESEFADVV